MIPILPYWRKGTEMTDSQPDFATLAIEQMQDPQTCLRIALQDPCGDPRRALEAMIAVIDRKLSTQLRGCTKNNILIFNV
jgi:hypothetical protein